MRLLLLLLSIISIVSCFFYCGNENAWAQFKSGFRGSLSMGRNFGFVGLVYAGTECYFEQVNKKKKINAFNYFCL